jgi:NAD-dependent deacetylase
MENTMQKLGELKQWLTDSQHTVVLTGAGMSTESGLPDFRSNDGLWHGKDPQQIASVQALNHNREEFVDFYRWRIRELQKVHPHAGYDILTRMQRQGYVHRFITQNVDGFHQRAGSHDVIELHGSLHRLYCTQCGQEVEAGNYLREDGEICSRCSGFLRPGIVLFGEMLPENAIREAFEDAARAELMIVMGSSLQVSPANMLPLETKQNSGRCVILNREPTIMDSQADLVVQGEIGMLVSDLNTLLDE